MNEERSISPDTLSSSFSLRRLPRWAELPDLELYMDQILALVDRYLGGYPGFDGKGLTASMVNNYVKLGVMPAPVRKKYAREHLAHLLMICILKSSLPIAAIRRLTESELESKPLDAVYDSFCALFEQTGAAVAASYARLGDDRNELPLHPIYHAALRAQADQALAMKLYALELAPDQTQK